MLDRAPERPPAWVREGHWALEVLERHLGEPWPAQVVARSSPGGGDWLLWSSSHVIAYINVLELALGLQLVHGLRGHAKLRKAITADPRPEILAHARLQLELAVLALRSGLEPELEPLVDGARRPVDVRFALDGKPLVVEARVVRKDEPWLAIEAASDAVFERIREFAFGCGLRVEGHLARSVDGAEVDELLAALEDRGRLVQLGATAPPLVLHGARLDVVPVTHSPAAGLTGPANSGDAWGRVRGRIAEKAEVARESGATWLRLDAVNGLWQFTAWSQMSLPAKLTMLAEATEPALGGLEGLVIGSGNLQRQGDFEDEDAFGPAGAVALRRLVEPSRVRETLVIPGPLVSSMAVDWWRTAYASEPRQLEWALAACGRSSLADILQGHI
jgi:hypothetical protein